MSNFDSSITPPAPVTDVARQFIPTGAPSIVNMAIERKAVRIAMNKGIPAIFVGHTGTAKTKLLQRLHQDAGWPYRAVPGHGQVEVETLVGKWIATTDGMQYKLGILPFCMKHGIAVGVQEINFVAPEVLVLLHEFVDEGFITLQELDPEHPDFVITPHPNFRLYGTMNPPELYPGARELSPALLRRCIVRSVEPLGREDELRVVLEQSAVNETTAGLMVDVAEAVREQFDQGQGLFWISTADLVMWAQLCDEDVTPYEAGEIAVIGKAPTGEVEFVRGRVRLSFENEGSN